MCHPEAGEENNFFLYGGVTSEPNNGLAKLEIFTNHECKWDIVYPQYVCEGRRIVGRNGFSSVYFNKQYYFIFGCMIYDRERKSRDCLDEVVVLNPTTMEIDI